MAEPYDTINAVGAGPAHWYRFSDVSDGVTDEGQGTARNLSEQSAGGAFNWTYQAEANPAGDGYGMEHGGQGGLLSSPLGLTAARGAICLVFRTTAIDTAANLNYMAGTWAGFDVYYNVLGAFTGTGNPLALWQNNTTSLDYVHVAATNLRDNEPHSLIYIPPSTTSGTSHLYVDGVAAVSPTLVEAGTPVDNNVWWDSYGEQVAVGYRGAVNDAPNDDVVIYEVAMWDELLTAGNVLTIHNALMGITSFSNKTIRRRNRKLFADYAAT